MSMMHQILPFAGSAALVAVLLTVLPGRKIKQDFWRRIFVFAMLVPCLLIPIYGLSVGQWLRTVVGDLSVLSLLVFIHILAQRLFGFKLLSPVSRKVLLIGVVLVGVLFYPLALGLTSIDPYHFGFRPTEMAALLLIASVMAWLKGQRGLAIVMLLPLLAFNLRLLESANLWDYLLDPVLFVYAVIQTAASVKLPAFKKRGTVT